MNSVYFRTYCIFFKNLNKNIEAETGPNNKHIKAQLKFRRSNKKNTCSRSFSFSLPRSEGSEFEESSEGKAFISVLMLFIEEFFFFFIFTSLDLPIPLLIYCLCVNDAVTCESKKNFATTIFFAFFLFIYYVINTSLVKWRNESVTMTISHSGLCFNTQGQQQQGNTLVDYN